MDGKGNMLDWNKIAIDKSTQKTTQKIQGRRQALLPCYFLFVQLEPKHNMVLVTTLLGFCAVRVGG